MSFFWLYRQKLWDSSWLQTNLTTLNIWIYGPQAFHSEFEVFPSKLRVTLAFNSLPTVQNSIFQRISPCLPLKFVKKNSQRIVSANIQNSTSKWNHRGYKSKCFTYSSVENLIKKQQNNSEKSVRYQQKSKSIT